MVFHRDFPSKAAERGSTKSRLQFHLSLALRPAGLVHREGHGTPGRNTLEIEGVQHCGPPESDAGHRQMRGMRVRMLFIHNVILYEGTLLGGWGTAWHRADHKQARTTNARDQRTRLA